MFYALTQGKIDTNGIEIHHDLLDIETLNTLALEGKSDVTAISIHNYAYVSNDYALLDSGGSIGYQYGPVLVAKQALTRTDIAHKRVALPGKYTSASLFFRLWAPQAEIVYLPFDQIFDAVNSGKVDAGVIIHEGQLNYREHGFVKVVDFGEWWFGETGLPLPLGANAVRKTLGMPLMKTLARLQRESIEYALLHRDEALAFAMNYARDLSLDAANRFVGMYVNERTVRYGDDDKRAIALMLKMAHERGIIPTLPQIEFISGD